MPQIMEVFVVPQITEEIMEVIQLGTKLLTCSLLCNDKCLGRQSRKLWRFRSSALPLVQFLGVVDMPVVVLDKCMIQTVQKTAEFAVWCGCRARRCATTGARFGPDSAETVGFRS